MARKIRFLPVGMPQHVIQRGNNRQLCFGSEEDFKAYLHWLKIYSEKHKVTIHAWVLMTNHVDGELLADIRNASNKGLVLGNDCFVDKLEALCGRRLKEGMKGRPKKNVL